MIQIINIIITFICLAIMYRGVKQKKYDSSLASWVIWSCIMTFSFLIYFVRYDWTIISSLLAAQAIGHIIMIFATYKYGEKTFSKQDWKCFVIAIIGFMVWSISSIIKLSNETFLTVLGITGQIIADFMGAYPYFRFVYKEPLRQPASVWGINIFIYPLAAYATWTNDESWTAYIFLAYGFLVYGVLFIVLLYSRYKKPQK